jgi:hypothetical protein
MTWVAAGVGSAALTFSAISSITGSKAKKKRQQELERKIAEISAKVAESVKNRLREVDKLTEEQIKFTNDSLKQVTEYYSDLKLKYQALYERNTQAAEEQYGAQLKEIEANLQQELGLSDDIFAEYQQGIDSLYGEVRDLYQADLAFNDGLKEEFRTNADEAIRNTWEATEDAKIDLQKLEDSGGRPENFDRVIAENAKAFGDIQTDIDRSDAARGRTDLTGKKLTTQFAEAMNRGNIAGQMGQQGIQQKQALRAEVTDLGNNAMNQSLAKLQGGQQTSGRELADIDSQFQTEKINALYDAGMARLGMTQDANQKESVATELYNGTINELRRMVQAGELSVDEAIQEERRLNSRLVMQAKEENWNYKDLNAKDHENQMLRTLGVATAEHASIDPRIDYGAIGMAGVQGFASTYGGGGFGGAAQKPATTAPAQQAPMAGGYPAPAQQQPSNIYLGGFQMPAQTPAYQAPTQQRNMTPYLGRFRGGY